MLPTHELPRERRLDEHVAPASGPRVRTDPRTQERGDGGLEAGVVSAVDHVVVPLVDELALGASEAALGLGEERGGGVVGHAGNDSATAGGG